MKRVIGISLLLFAGVAFAGDNVGPSNNNGPVFGGGDGGNAFASGGNATAGAISTSGASARQDQLQGQGQLQGQAQKQSQGNVQQSSTGGNTLTVNEAPIPAVTQQDINYGGDYKVRNVPGVVAPNIYPSAPCMRSMENGNG